MFVWFSKERHRNKAEAPGRVFSEETKRKRRTEMSGDRQSSGSGAVVRVRTGKGKGEGEGEKEKEPKKRKIPLDREEHSVLSRYAQVLNGKPDAISDFLRGFRGKFPYSKIVSVEDMKQVLQCIRGEKSEVILEKEKPPPCSVFNLPINKVG